VSCVGPRESGEQVQEWTCTGHPPVVKWAFFYLSLVSEDGCIIAGVMAYAVVLSMVVVLCRPILGPIDFLP
jgi:hypothetical protein